MKINLCIECSENADPLVLSRLLAGFNVIVCAQLLGMKVDENLQLSDPELTPFVSAFRSE